MSGTGAHATLVKTDIFLYNISMSANRNVKIYGTLGPACSDPLMLKRMFEEGMDGIRLNLSHTSLAESGDLIDVLFSAASACGVRPEFMIDMQGPELRVGRLDEPLRLREGDVIRADSIPLPKTVTDCLKNDSRSGKTVQTERDASSKDVPGDQEILLDDGKILLRAESGGNLRVVRGGLLQGRKSIALPGCCIEAPAMTAADRENILNAKKYGVTAVMQPFVRSREDLIELRRALDESDCSDVRIFAKIENLTGMESLEELIPHCDEIVIARGDLGNAMELWELPAAQKRIAAACRRAGRNFMVVTQMLDSMTHRQVPTRAEVSDIFNAVLDGAASVMVTGETAAGEYPDMVIRYMAKTVREACRYRDM